MITYEFLTEKNKNSYLTHVLLKNYNFNNYYPLYLIFFFTITHYNR